jgi:oxygen-dependent protoporphyrinogen oxidase
MARVARIEQTVRKIPNLAIGGNAFHGIGVPDCVRMGKEAAVAVAPQLDQQPGLISS